MTLRDLSKRQLYNLRRKCEMERKRWLKQRHGLIEYDRLQENSFAKYLWEAAYNTGLKDGLNAQ